MEEQMAPTVPYQTPATVARFLDAAYERVEGGAVTFSSIYQRYREWCKAEGLVPCSAPMLGRRLVALGYPSVVAGIDGRPVRVRVGLRPKGEADA